MLVFANYTINQFSIYYELFKVYTKYPSNKTKTVYLTEFIHRHPYYKHCDAKCHFANIK